MSGKRTGPKIKDLTGLQVGKLKVLKIAHRDDKTRQWFWKCLCDCGNVIKVRGAALTKARPTRSCGCIKAEVNREIAKGNLHYPLMDKEDWRRYKHTLYKYRYSYNLEEVDVQDLLNRSKGCCEICRKGFNNKDLWHVDHCHETGKVRGLLCMHCNHMLGNALDNIPTLIKGAEYLKISKENYND